MFARSAGIRGDDLCAADVETEVRTLTRPAGGVRVRLMECGAGVRLRQVSPDRNLRSQ